MGNSLDKIGGYEESSDSSNDVTIPRTVHIKKSGKGTRKRGADKKNQPKDEDSDEPAVKSFKLDTPHYLYEKLFLRGEDSNISVRAINKTWKLHRFYLQQCSFFEALLNGDWKDSKKEFHELDIPDDPNITIEGLDAVFGSLYQNELSYKEEDLISIAATSSYFQLDSVLQRCDEEMESCLNDKNIVEYLHVAEKYGLTKVKKTAHCLLKWNFWKLMRDRKILGSIDETNLKSLMSSPELLIVEGEMDLYEMLKTWIFLQYNAECMNLNDDEFKNRMNTFFSEMPPNFFFLKFSQLFSSLRLHHLVVTTASIRELERDGIIPREVMRSLMVDHWKTALENEEKPEGVTDITNENFYINCTRLGRIVDSSPKCWRWSGYNGGIDIILNYNKGLLTMKRNCLSQSTPYSINLKTERAIHFRLLVCDKHGTALHDSTKQVISMRLDQSVVICRLSDTTSLPITVHFFYMATQAPPPSFLYVNKFVSSIEEK